MVKTFQKSVVIKRTPVPGEVGTGVLGLNNTLGAVKVRGKRSSGRLRGGGLLPVDTQSSAVPLACAHDAIHASPDAS